MKYWALLLLAVCSITACGTSNGIFMRHKISKEEAAGVAQRFLEENHVNLGSPVAVKEWDGKCGVVIQKSIQTWDACYFVVYSTSESEKKILGEKAVAVTLDGSRAAFTLRD